MSGHTPGPWFSEGAGGSWFIRPSAASPAVGQCCIGHSNVEANACLIAAAPDLLEALVCVEYVVRKALPDELLAEVRAAIAKARGLESAGMLPRNDAPNRVEQKGETFGEAVDKADPPPTLRQMREVEVKRRMVR